MTVIGIIGAGEVGSQIARAAIANGYDVVIANSRGPETLKDLIDELGPSARAATAAGSAAAGEFAVVAVPLKVVNDMPAWRVLMHAPKLFAGTVARVPGVSMTKTRRLEIASDVAVVYHVDGEPYVGGQCVSGRVHARALRVMSAIR